MAQSKDPVPAAVAPGLARDSLHCFGQVAHTSPLLAFVGLPDKARF